MVVPVVMVDRELVPRQRRHAPGAGFVGLATTSRCSPTRGSGRRRCNTALLLRRQRRRPPLLGLGFAMLLNSPARGRGRQGRLPRRPDPALALHRRGHRGAVAPDPRPERRRQLRPHHARADRQGHPVVRRPRHRAAGRHVHEHLGGLLVLHDQPARRSAGHPRRPVRGGQGRRRGAVQRFFNITIPQLKPLIVSMASSTCSGPRSSSPSSG